MQAQFIDQYCINSFMYTNNQVIKKEDSYYISPQAYQKRVMKKKPSKKIILGKPCSGKHKMTLDELKALSRQIQPPKDDYTNIDSLVKKLKDNMNRAKSRMLQQLKQSDIDMYHHICPEEDEDDYSSVSTASLPTYQDIYQSILCLYPTLDVTTCHKNTQDTAEVTEDQINTWLQRGGFSSNPIPMATDQELADLLHFDEL